MSDGRSRARPAHIEPVIIHYPFSPPASQRSCLLQRVSQDRFIDEERIDVTDIVFFGIQAAVPIQFSGLRGVHAQARGDACPACPSERLQAHMGSRAAPTAQPLRAQSGGRPLDEGRASMLAGDGERQAGAADAPRTLVHGPIHHPYLYGWAPVHTV